MRYSDGSYLECQDYWRYSGIERSVSLIARPKSRIHDFKMDASLTNDYRDGHLSLAVEAHNPAKGHFIEAKVLSDGKTIWSERHRITSRHDTLATFDHTFGKVLPWNAETPNTYTLVLNYIGAKGKVAESATHVFGFRNVEMRNGQILINGRPVLFKGVNRHEHDAVSGRTITIESMVKDIEPNEGQQHQLGAQLPLPQQLSLV